MVERRDPQIYDDAYLNGERIGYVRRVDPSSLQEGLSFVQIVQTVWSDKPGLEFRPPPPEETEPTESPQSPRSGPRTAPSAKVRESPTKA